MRVLRPDTRGGVANGDAEVVDALDTAEYTWHAAGADATPGSASSGLNASVIGAASAAIARAAAAAALFGSANGVQSGGPNSKGDDLLRERELSDRGIVLAPTALLSAGTLRLLLRPGTTPFCAAASICCALPLAMLAVFAFAAAFDADGFLSPNDGTVNAAEPGTAAVAVDMADRAELLAGLEFAKVVLPGWRTPSVK